MDYLICPAKSEEDRDEWEKGVILDMRQEMTEFTQLDYFVDKQGKTPLSFAMCQTEEDGAAWYAQHYPELPDLAVEVACKAQWGAPPAAQTKKTKPEFSIEQGEVTVDLS